jgi:hypothetical protein
MSVPNKQPPAIEVLVAQNVPPIHIIATTIITTAVTTNIILAITTTVL